MKLVHFADTHLGFRQFDRVTPLGINRREADVEDTFASLVTKVIAIQPDVIIVGGDIFHSPRPSNHAIVNAILEFQRLARSLPSTRIVLVSGNHDSAKSTETGGILGSLTPLGIHVVDNTAARIEFDDLSLSVLAIPEAPGVVRPALEPQSGFTYNVMVMHGEVQGMPTHHDETFLRAEVVPTEEMHLPEWNYIGLGHYHVYQELAPNMFYSGSINYTSTNPWGEMLDEDKRGLDGKGFVERDLDTGAQTFHALPGRPYLDLPSFSALDMTSDELNAAIRAVVDPRAIEGKAARLVITECSRELRRTVDDRLIKDYQRVALNFSLATRLPERVRVFVGGRMMRNGLSLEQRLRGLFEDRPAVPGIDKATLIEGALAYLNQTADPYAVATPDSHSIADLVSGSLDERAHDGAVLGERAASEQRVLQEGAAA